MSTWGSWWRAARRWLEAFEEPPEYDDTAWAYAWWDSWCEAWGAIGAQVARDAGR